MANDLPGLHLLRLLGRGGRGEVWLARVEGPVERLVAVKRLHHPGVAAASFLEASLAGALDHPHLVRLLDVVDDPPGVALVMPYLTGGSLRDLLAHRGTLTAGEVVAVLEPVAAAVASLERHGLVHGDLKPDNVLLTADGEPVLADVGVARRIGAVATGLGVVGTPAYLDPAVAEGGPPGPAAEVYSLGVVAYEALTARAPHRGEPAEVVAAAGAGAHRRLETWPSVPAAVAEVVEAALCADPAARPPDAAAFVARLRAAVDPSEVTLPGPCPPHRLSGAGPDGTDHRTVRLTGPSPELAAPEPRRRRFPVPALAAVAVAAVGVLAVAIVTGALRGVVPGGGGSRPAGRTAAACRSSRPAPPGLGPVHRVDVDADGCPERARWDGRVLRAATAAGPVAYAIGAAGDRLLVGDWDGDGRATPALYRPAAGVVLYVDRFPGAVGDRVPASRVAHVVRQGSARVVAGRDGVDRVVVGRPPAPGGPPGSGQ